MLVHFGSAARDVGSINVQCVSSEAYKVVRRGSKHRLLAQGRRLYVTMPTSEVAC